MEQESENLSHIQGHFVTRDRQLSLLIKTDNPYQVLEEVHILFSDMFRNGDFTQISQVFEDVIQLFNGNFPGFKSSTTPYHNLKHTTDVFLAMARLIHGAHCQKAALNEVDVRLGLIAALMHDTGYIQKHSENYGSGAKLASLHVGRGIELMTRNLTLYGYSRDQILQCEQAILCTDLEKPLNTIPFHSPSTNLLGTMLASADLLAQTADRTYLEKLPLLYREFTESGAGNYECEIDLIKDAPHFNNRMNERLTIQLNGVNSFFQNHFRIRWDIDADLYQEAIDRAMTYLAHILESNAENYKSHLRRALTRTFHET